MCMSQRVTLPPGLCICREPECKIPFGYCHCGCGGITALAAYSCVSKGCVIDSPKKFVSGHHIIDRPPIETAVSFKLGGEYCRLIPLTRGLWCIVSAHRYNYLMRWKWSAARHKNTGRYYAARRASRTTCKRQMISMHRFILGLSFGDPLTGDHVSRIDTLNNADHNLRFANDNDQQHNKGLCKLNSSGYKGVYFFKRVRRWRAAIKINGKSIHLGYYDIAEDAARVYDKAAIEMFGEFAVTNDMLLRERGLPGFSIE